MTEKKEVKAKQGRTITNKRNGVLVLLGVEIKKGGEYILTDSDVENKLLMAKVNHAKTLGLISLV